MEVGQHPEEKIWLSFIQGKLSEDRIELLEQHLENCDDCCKLVSILNRSDRLAEAIRKAHHLDPTADMGRSMVQGNTTSDFSNATENRTTVDRTRFPTRFGRFELIRKLGQGGFGIVWLAFDPQLVRQIALKVPSSGALITREQKSRFFREAKAAAGLHHANIVQVFDAGEYESVCFIASEFCVGSDLHNWLQKNKPSPTLAAWIVSRICDAVAHAHERGILHRDLKPSNILLEPITCDSGKHAFVSEFGFEPKVADFGLAKIVADDHDETATRAVMGSINYMSPEQTRGSIVDERSDIYSLGVILYLMLAGRVPYKGKTDLETLQIAGIEPATSPRRYRPGVPIDLETICLKCLSSDSQQRYPSAYALQDDLLRFVNREPIRARPVSKARKILLWCRRKPWIAAVWILMLLTTLGALAFSWALAGQRNLARQNLAEKQVAEKKARLALFESNLQQVRLGRLGNHRGRRFSGLAATQTAADLLEELGLDATKRMQLRNESIGCLSLLDLEVERLWTIPRTKVDTTGIAVDRDLNRYATWTAEGNIEIRSLLDNRVLSTIDNAADKVSGREDWHLDLSFSPDSRFLATKGMLNAHSFRVWDLKKGSSVVLELPKDSSAAGAHFVFDRQSQWIATIHTEVIQYSLTDGHEIGRISTPDSIGPFDFVSDRQLAYATSTGLNVVTSSGTPAMVIPMTTGTVESIACHPNGNQVAFSIGKTIYLHSLTEDGTQVELPLEHSSPILSVFFSEDGQYLVSSAWDGTTCLWDPEQAKLLLRTDRTAITFSRDKKYLAFGLTGNEIGRWQLADGSERRDWQADEPIEYLTFGLDGRLLIYGGLHEVVCRDTATGKLLTRTAPGQVSSCWVAPDNSRLWLAGPSGLYQVPITIDGEENLTLRLGDAEAVSSVGSTCYRLAGTPDGKFLAVSRAGDGRRLVVLDTSTGIQVAPDTSVAVAHYHSISPDGTMVSVANWHGYECFVYSIQERQLLTKVASQSANSSFSPDGHWLIVGDGSGYRIIDTSNWLIRRHIERDLSGGAAAMAFDKDGGVVAIADGFRSVKLLKCDDWSEIATLWSHPTGNIRELAISPSGELLAASHLDQSITLWDLRKIRSGLAKYGLDWDLPGFPPANRFQNAKTIAVELR